MSLLRGHFSMMLIVDAPTDQAAAQLETDLVQATEALGLVVTVRSIEDVHGSAEPGTPWMISVYGADQPGIVYRVTDLLARNNVNIVDVTTHVTEGDEAVYTMLIEASVPKDTDETLLSRSLANLAEELGVACTARPVDGTVL